ncbi:SubName: Full=Uncharacterized protein {ECO:0000313/EMBL:CCA70170.1} [Serendipita indica DSM 11827]|uniref:Autophagy-related protein 16 domain-containing protein n=1 Tax=Serendipita indica (strain DSM 11827) TaxID=1109443 RepID=G4TFR9_SERID|nr:SubName: Full=Uncharacterized protein {ECO:0000313/EMBL:CCA70170.1} [Serendipita indica DSM 11827]CCA70170.1 hypothetical protein PIIN_04109 [Serendipita indica DSM 11827]
MSWQEVLRQRLVDRNIREASHGPVIDQYRRLAQHTRLLNARNQTLLRATGAARPNPNSSTVMVGEDNPVRTAYIQSLESQVSALRDEMAASYKTQGQNAQRLLAMNETLREREDAARIDAENLRLAREEVAVLRRKVEQHAEQMAEKDRAFQDLTDEYNLLNLEFGQVEEQKDNLKKDNATLIQRWIDKQNSIGDVLNERNEMWYETMQTRQQSQDGGGNGMRSRPSQESLASSFSHVSGNGSRPFQPPVGREQYDRKGADPAKGGLLLSPNG